MKVLLVSALALLPLATTAALDLGHAPPPRTSAQVFPLTLDGLGAAGARLEIGDANCVVVRAQGASAILGGRATLASPERRPPAPTPGRLMLEARAPHLGVEDVQGALPLALEVAPADLARGDTLTLAVHLPEGAVAAAAGARVDLALTITHAGAPIHFAVEGCEPAGP